MDFFATLFSITANTPEVEPTPSTPIETENNPGANGGYWHCIVA
jgi:hypothetical protein